MKRMLKVLREVHRNERGAVSIETVLILGAIALPVLLFLYKYWNSNITPWVTKKLDEITSDTTTAPTP
jgi:Flp pilus assembly pilin Flp